jgi:hypothetical protein
MTPDRICWGIYRERAHSPGRVDDDAAIMDAAAEHLRALGHTVRLVHPDAADEVFEQPRPAIFAMCERAHILDRLQAAEDAGAMVVNSPYAIRNTYRHRLVELFAARQVPAPPSWIMPTDTTAPAPAEKVWIKRYDFHATQADDVLPASAADWPAMLARFASRGMGRVVVQAHVPGDLIKFYGVGQGPAAWFDWFYHRDQDLSGHDFQRARLAQVAQSAAAAVGLEVFGGDAIVGADGEPVIIDINAWPSFALRRKDAAPAIAARLAALFAQLVRVPS